MTIIVIMMGGDVLGVCAVVAVAAAPRHGGCSLEKSAVEARSPRVQKREFVFDFCKKKDSAVKAPVIGRSVLARKAWTERPVKA